MQKISKISILSAFLISIFVVGLSASSLPVNAAQTDAGNIPASGTISDTFVYNSLVVQDRGEPPYGGSVIYSVLPETEYYIRVRVPSPSPASLYLHYFETYPSVGSNALSYFGNYVRNGDYITFHFTTVPNAHFVVLSFRFSNSYSNILSFIESSSIGDSLGLYLPLSNRSSAELTFGFVNPREIRLTLAGFGGVGDYMFTVDVNYSDDNSENLLYQVPSGNYTLVVPAFDDGDYLTITISDILTSITTQVVPVIPDVNVNTIPSPNVDISAIPDTSISVDADVADIFADTLNILPSEITALLIPVVLFCLVGWWMHK